MHIALQEIDGSSNIGLYAHITSKIILVGHTVPDAEKEKMQEVLGLPTIDVSVAESNLVGAFLTSKGNTVIAPNILTEEEKNILENTPHNIAYVDVTHNCLGNNIITTPNHSFINPDYSKKDTKTLRKAIGQNITKKKIGGVKAVGTLVKTNIPRKRFIITNTVTDEEFEEVQEKTGLKGTPTTVNMGSPYIHAGVLTSKNGVLVGENSGGPEVTQIDKGLGFVTNE